jgi:hypothetical protein
MLSNACCCCKHTEQDFIERALKPSESKLVFLPGNRVGARLVSFDICLFFFSYFKGLNYFCSKMSSINTSTGYSTKDRPSRIELAISIGPIIPLPRYFSLFYFNGYFIIYEETNSLNWIFKSIIIIISISIII